MDSMYEYQMGDLEWFTNPDAAVCSKTSHQYGDITRFSAPSIDVDTLNQINFVDPAVFMQNVQLQHSYYGLYNTTPEPIDRNTWKALVPTSSSLKTCSQAKSMPRISVIGKPKRFRTAYTTDQIMTLEREYARKKYLNSDRRKKLAGIIRVDERAISTWFKNRRQKEKKDRMNDSSSFSSTPETLSGATCDYPTPVVEELILRHNGAFLKNEHEEIPTDIYNQATNACSNPMKFTNQELQEGDPKAGHSTSGQHGYWNKEGVPMQETPQEKYIVDFDLDLLPN